MELKFNPFKDFGITTAQQYKKYPFLCFGTLGGIKLRVEQQIRQIKNGYTAGERVIILGEKGIGKTSTLFFIKEMLDEEHIKNFLLSRLISDMECYELLTGEGFFESTQKDMYILIDFPDSIETKQYRDFLTFLWNILIHPNNERVNLIFTMNKSHFDKSFSHSEIFGKFITMGINRLNPLETEELISSRLKQAESKIEDIFTMDITQLIFNYSKGIPRNIISACNLLISLSNNNKIKHNLAEGILKEKYTDKIIDDRIEDLELKRIFKAMVGVLKNDFNGVAEKQEDYINRVKEVTGIGRNSIIDRLDDLLRFGIIRIYKGGYNRVNKIISLN